MHHEPCVFLLNSSFFMFRLTPDATTQWFNVRLVLSVVLVNNDIKISLRAVGVASGKIQSATYLQRLLTGSLQVLTNLGGATGTKCDSTTIEHRIPLPALTIPPFFVDGHFLIVWGRRHVAQLRHKECQWP